MTRAEVGLRSERGPVLLSVMLATGLVAIDATILASAVPAVVDDLGGFTEFPWLFSVYLLAQAVSVPLYGKLSDTFGRKPVMLVGVGLFLLGSVLCGSAWSMTSLIVFRLLQGLGAGAVQPVGMTILGDLYSTEERATVQGYIASVWGVASLVGPALGGVFSDFASWRWIFWVNLPIGAAAVWMLVRRFDEQVTRRSARPDLAGSALLTLGGTALLLALLEGGVRWTWASPVSLALMIGSVALLVGFVLVEARVADPVLPLWLFRSPVLVAAMTTGLVVGVLMMGLTTYVPLYAQSVLGTDAVTAGMALAAMTIGWPIAAANAGRLYLAFGYRVALLLGAVAIVAGAAMLPSTGEGSSVWHLAVGCFVMGLGFGLMVSPSVVAGQSAVGWRTRGVATAALMFARLVGSAVGVAAFGALVNTRVAQRLGSVPASLEQVSPQVLAPAVHDVFVVSAVVAVLLLGVAFLMPHRVESPVTEE